MPKEPMTEERIAEIRGREKAATRGPWHDECVIGRRKEIETFHTIRDKDGAIVDVLPISAYHDAAFIAHAREDIPALLAEVERLMAENEALKLRVCERQERFVAQNWRNVEKKRYSFKKFRVFKYN